MSGIGVEGLCPNCGWKSLVRAAGGHLVCSRLRCLKPAAADDLLHRQPAPQESRKVEWAETLRNDGTYEYTSSGDCHGTVEYHLRRRPALAPGRWEPVEVIPYDARYPHEPSPVSPAPVTTRAADEHDDRPGAHEPGRSASTT